MTTYTLKACHIPLPVEEDTPATGTLLSLPALS